MDTFTALAEPTRRLILERLMANGKMSATDICRGFKSSPPAISQHLKVLREAKLVHVEKRAQQRIYYVNPEPMKEFERWIKQFAASKEQEFQRLDKLLESMKADAESAPLLPFE
ncbi:MAG: winged helix-turn-helix transcriptional regulator [Acidobacteria bacterium]|nr:winged helix-turn-helix transcriptional regulator [Acidobacteriota bacterium]